MTNKENDDLNSLFEDDSIFENEASETKEGIKKSKKNEIIEKIKVLARNIGIIAAVCFIVYLVFFSGEDKNISSEKNQNISSKSETEEDASKIKLAELKEKYDAIVFDEQDFTFSLEIQEKDNKIFILEESIQDIYKKGDEYFITIDGWNYFGKFKINKDQINNIKENLTKDQFFETFFLVVEVDEISKFLFETEIEEDGEDNWIYREPSDDFLIEGSLLDFKKSLSL